MVDVSGLLLSVSCSRNVVVVRGKQLKCGGGGGGKKNNRNVVVEGKQFKCGGGSPGGGKQ